jgi:hypothetical protein
MFQVCEQLHRSELAKVRLFSAAFITRALHAQGPQFDPGQKNMPLVFYLQEIKRGKFRNGARTFAN